MWTFASKLMYLRFNKILEPKKRKSFTVSIFSPSICHEVTGIKIAGRKINNLRYADDTTQRAGSEEE